MFKSKKSETSTVFTRKFAFTENESLLALAIGVGLATGFGIWLFHVFIDVFHEIFTVFIAEHTLDPIIGGLGIVVSLALAGAIVGLVVHRWIGTERHHGVAGIMEAVAFAGGHLPYRLMPFKAISAALSLGAGASVGPEDPSVQIGANIGSFFGQRLHLTEDRVRMLVAAGSASAIAAAFEAPIAGVFFALEVVLNGAMSTSSVGVIVLSAVVSSAFTQAVQGTPELLRLTYSLGNPAEILLFVPLGFLLAPIGIIFIRVVFWQHDVWHHKVNLPLPLKTALAGAIVGVIGIFFPEALGGVRDFMNEVLSGESQVVIIMFLILGAVKIIATGISMAGGFVGGIFAPSLFVGTMFGAAYGFGLEGILGDGLTTDPHVFAVAGMAGMMAGVVRSPITAIMLVFEITNDYRLILPIMLTTVICVYVGERFNVAGVYTNSLLRKGVRLQQGRDIDVMQGVTVGEAMIKPAPVISQSASLAELRDTLRKFHTLSLCVLDDDGLLSGVVTLSDLQRAFDIEETQSNVKSQTVGDIASKDVATTYPEEVLWMAIKRMSERDVGRLPVVKQGTREVIGLIGRHGVVRAYNIAISRKLRDQHTAERVRLHALTGGHAFEVYIAATAPITGKRISEINWPHESVIASILRKGKIILPHGNTQLEVGDLLTIVADEDAEHEIQELAGRKPVSSSSS
ncbi:MAG: chloride channel protein [Aggregatilineales bacterium]